MMLKRPAAVWFCGRNCKNQERPPADCRRSPTQCVVVQKHVRQPTQSKVCFAYKRLLGRLLPPLGCLHVLHSGAGRPSECAASFQSVAGYKYPRRGWFRCLRRAVRHLLIPTIHRQESLCFLPGSLHNHLGGVCNRSIVWVSGKYEVFLLTALSGGPSAGPLLSAGAHRRTGLATVPLPRLMQIQMSDAPADK